MHRDCQSQPKLFWIWFRQFGEQTETLPLTIIRLGSSGSGAKIPKAHFGWHDEKNACVSPTFLAKAYEGTVQYAFDHANNFTLLSVAPKKNKRVVFLSTMHSEKKTDEKTGKDTNVFYNQGKVVWTDRPNVQLVYHGKKNKPLAKEALLWND
jgi:hypothetical protein